MHNFEWNLPTKIVYGKGELSRLGELCNEYGRKAFLATYRRSEKRAWILDTALSSLKAAGIEVVEACTLVLLTCSLEFVSSSNEYGFRSRAR